MWWSLEPRVGYGERRTRIDDRTGVPRATAGGTALALGAGRPANRSAGPLRSADRQERLVDVGPALVANSETPVLVKPRDVRSTT